MRREDEESDEEDEAWRNIQNRVVDMVAVMMCLPTQEQPQWGGSVACRSYKPRNRVMTHVNLMNNYFNPNSMYTEEDFKRRFRIRHHVFECSLRDVQQVNPYFRQKRDKVGHPGFSPHQNVTVALRMMAYGSLVDSMDETHDEYLCELNKKDLDQLICKVKDHGFPGMIGSLDYMHWDWKNFPSDGNKAYAEVLGRSPFFNTLAKGKAPQLDYYIIDRQYNMWYYLADSIYPKWATLVQAIPNPMNDAKKLFTLHQEAYRKDVERVSICYKHDGRSSANRQEGGVKKIWTPS
ncbi:uncharacterized protein [Malus domestica]|uniref:uncharacterized protein n=1 Tax=Malus domestica TaxID=3750 RepID=UPI003974AEC0